MALYDFLSGAVAFGFFTCCLYFLRSWRRSRDSLFLGFAVAFALLGFGEAVLSLGNIPTEDTAAMFLIRLAAFGIIIFAIVRKNRAGSSR